MIAIAFYFIAIFACSLSSKGMLPVLLVRPYFLRAKARLSAVPAIGPCLHLIPVRLYLAHNQTSTFAWVTFATLETKKHFPCSDRQPLINIADEESRFGSQKSSR